jgi:hypothetical protein
MQRPPRVVGSEARMVATSRCAAVLLRGLRSCHVAGRASCLLPASAMGKEHKKRKHSHKHDTCVLFAV